MHWIDWTIVAGLVTVLFIAAVYTARFTTSVSGFLAAERCGGRYLIAMATAMAGIGVISLVYWFEIYYETGFAGTWWNSLSEPAMIILALSGFVVYRFRRTRAMTLAQFFEMRYSRNFRVFSGLVAYVAGIINFGIFPAVGARFFIALCGLPHTWPLGPFEISTFATVMAALLSISLVFTFLGGLVAVMVTDFIQGIFANLVFIVVMIFLLGMFEWNQIAAAMLEAPSGKSMVDPFNMAGQAEFDIWYFLIAIFVIFYTWMGWQGTAGYYVCAKSPHEMKMANVLWGWRFRVLLLVTVVIPIAIVTMMRTPEFAEQALQVQGRIDAISAPDAEQVATLRNQLRAPHALAVMLPTGLLGLMCAAMLAAFISTHDSYLHSWGSIFVQDVILPLRRKPLSPRMHLRLLRISIFGVAVFIFVFSLLYRPTQYITMFLAITGAVFVGGAGAAIIGGLYWKRGTAYGAWAGMITGMTLSTVGIVIKQLSVEQINALFGTGAGQRIVMYIKESITGQELTFYAIVCAICAYVTASLLGPRPNIDLDKVLRRGKFAVNEDEAESPGSARPLLERFGIDREFTTGDRIVTFISVGWPVVWSLVLIVGIVLGSLGQIPESWWVTFWRIWMGVFLAGAIGVTIWFSIGGAKDVAYLFRRLRRVGTDPKDDGREDHHAYETTYHHGDD